MCERRAPNIEVRQTLNRCDTMEDVKCAENGRFELVKRNGKRVEFEMYAYGWRTDGDTLETGSFRTTK